MTAETKSPTGALNPLTPGRRSVSATPSSRPTFPAMNRKKKSRQLLRLKILAERKDRRQVMPMLVLADDIRRWKKGADQKEYNPHEGRQRLIKKIES